MKFLVIALLATVAFASDEELVIKEAKEYLMKKTSAPETLFSDPFKLATSDDFEKFIHQYGKQYKDDEEKARRFHIFQVNMIIADVFQKFELGSARYGATKFADLSIEEFKQQYLSPVYDQTNRPTQYAEIPKMEAPTSFDWRTKGAVTPVKNQEQCGSCWAFSTTGNIEGQWFIKKGKLISLSEQELVDCDKLDQGCGGGLPSNAYKEIIRLGGLVTEKDYPYTARDGTCHLNKQQIVVTINGSVSISQDEGQMATWCAANGPISIGINAAAMQLYFGGISHPWKIFCSPSHLDHGVLIVGYGVKGSEPYWIIKNSWGASWGEEGYYLVYRGDGVCGLNKMCTSATV